MEVTAHAIAWTKLIEDCETPRAVFLHLFLATSLAMMYYSIYNL